MNIGDIEKFIIHYVGNKNNGEGVRFSDNLTDIEDNEEHIKKLIVNNFKSEELYKFYFHPTLDLHPMYQFINSIFNNNETFIEQSQNAGRLLYDKSTHPQIKAGELCIIFFKNCELNNKLVDCIGLFKSENKDTILKINTTNKGYHLQEEKGINLKKLDKGCLIYNLNEEDGYLISVVDNTNKSVEAQYWKDDFLGVKFVNNEFHQTNEFLGITKQFVTEEITENLKISKAEKIDLLNRSVEYFKANEKFEKDEFEKEVFKDEKIIESFRDFDNKYRIDNEIELSNSFDISSQAVKKQARVFKSVLKLDKNFHIYIHGNKDLIEQGVEKDGRKYYKIYYENEI